MRRLRIWTLALLLGGVWRLYEYNAWFSLHDYAVKASDPVLERRLWEVFPSEALRFWPFFIRQSREVGDFLERKLPVTVVTEMRGLGRFITSLRWLSPWLKVEWRGRMWCISEEGRMWDAVDPDMVLPGEGAEAGPFWRLGILSDDQGRIPGGVFPSPFPLEKIREFLSEYRRYVWFGDVKEINWERRGGADLFRLSLLRGRQVVEILIQKDKYGRQELGGMIGDILGRLLKEGGNHLIDATYEGKIVLKGLSAGPK